MKNNNAWFVVLAALAAACSSARRSETVAGPLNLSDQETLRGAAVFMGSCNKCHPLGEAGLGPALNNKPLPKFMMRLQIRKGLGAMPAFSEKEISDGELDDLL
ncbi:MAG TPA: cytochrome c, partial [Planctomycetota bacterium]|nr:cytochrome c [Planctomycetota bacterium]